MKFVSLTTMILSAAVMAGVAIASENLTINPMNLPCDNPNKVGCSLGIKGFNNGNDFGYECGPTGEILAYASCDCKNCCVVLDNGGNFTCE
ncbi:hypothetical protein DFH29DRAFT_938953 [Suillus ampliporus]|nr:hypothetical protein DFH29DRAFT_938953 [Suillus ampliporus]